MKERPILFNAEMVNAILSGRKTQTRRVIKGCPDVQHGWYPDRYNNSEEWTFWGPRGSGDAGRCTLPFVKCPFGEIGDRLWVRETFGFEIRSVGGSPHEQIVYSASKPDAVRLYDCNGNPYPMKWTPSIHMPRWASRITLEITGIRVERLNDITLGDICKEIGCGLYDFRPATHGFQVWEDLWKSIYGADNWQANPWVWVIEFKMVGQPHAN